ncbi:MAG: hypothetical protein ACRDIL_07945 [Candidatus Limnocylindrales bacterium]
MTLRALPWVLAVVGVLVPLVGNGFSTWPLAVAWLLLLGALRVFGRLPPARAERIALAVAALPVLFLLAFEGGWWLIPAVVAWLLIELADRRQAGSGSAA